jgi:hypothetical protein
VKKKDSNDFNLTWGDEACHPHVPLVLPGRNRKVGNGKVASPAGVVHPLERIEIVQVLLQHDLDDLVKGGKKKEVGQSYLQFWESPRGHGVGSPSFSKKCNGRGESEKGGNENLLLGQSRQGALDLVCERLVPSLHRMHTPSTSGPDTQKMPAPVGQNENNF